MHKPRIRSTSLDSLDKLLVKVAQEENDLRAEESMKSVQHQNTLHHINETIIRLSRKNAGHLYEACEPNARELSRSSRPQISSKSLVDNKSPEIQVPGNRHSLKLSSQHPNMKRQRKEIFELNNESAMEDNQYFMSPVNYLSCPPEMKNFDFDDLIIQENLGTSRDSPNADDSDFLLAAKLLCEGSTNTKANRSYIRLCSEPSCQKFARENDKCIKHGGGVRCSVKNCKRSASSQWRAGKRCYTNARKNLLKTFDHLSSEDENKPLCAAHGGGIPCAMSECTSTARSFTRFCMHHGNLFYAMELNDSSNKELINMLENHEPKSKKRTLMSFFDGSFSALSPTGRKKN